MRIQSPVVWLWSCLSAFTFIHTAIAQDYSADPFSDSISGGVAPADYGDSETYSENSELMPTQYDAGYSGGYDPAYDPAAGGTIYDGSEPGGAFPPAYGGMSQPYPPPMMPPNAYPYPQISPHMSPDIDRTYRQNGLWVNEGLSGNRKYFMSLEYLRTWSFHPGTDLVGARGVDTFPTIDRAYSVVNVGVLGNGEHLPSDALRATFKLLNSDTSSLELSGWWAAESSLSYNAQGKGDPGDVTTLFPRGAITYYDGTAGGTAVPFDTEFELGYKSQAFGADLTWASMPIWDTDGFKIRALGGLQYIKIREQFTFHGEDSALLYEFDPATGAVDPTTVLPNPLGLPPFQSDMVSRVRSDVGGPMIGLRYELGGKNFLLTGQSKLTVAANGEMINLYGNQMGDGFAVGFPTPTPGNPKPSYFEHKRQNTHVSPIFNQDFNFKGKVFKHLPIFNDIPLFAHADLLLGYNFILVGEVARPTKIIDYRINNPRIQTARSRWLMQAATFGLQWEF